ncbi:MAG: hypothetical protein K2Q18_15960 [Bdellovibrionales bacterium]|nr:hypothetical protein [Bdellovibrionales bacterium]
MNLFLGLILFFSIARASDPGEYILTVDNTLSIEAVKLSLTGLPPDEIRALGNGMYLLKYQKDPGVVAFKSNSLKGLTIQKNLTYKAFKKTHKRK